MLQRPQPTLQQPLNPLDLYVPLLHLPCNCMMPARAPTTNLQPPAVKLTVKRRRRRVVEVAVVVVEAHDLVCLAVLLTAPLSVLWEWAKGASVCFRVLTSGRVQWQSLHLPLHPQL